MLVYVEAISVVIDLLLPLLTNCVYRRPTSPVFGNLRNENRGHGENATSRDATQETEDDEERRAFSVIH